MLRKAILTSAAAVAMIAAAPSLAQGQERPNDGPKIQEATQQFLKEKKAEQAEVVRELRSQGIAYGQVRSLVAKFGNIFRANSRVAKTDLAEEVNAAFLDDIALELAVLGFGPADLRDEAVAKRLFDAAMNKRRATATAADYMLLSQAVVIGRAVEYTFENATGPSPAFLVLEVESVEKGNLTSGERIRIPLRSTRLGENLFQRDFSETLPEPGSSVRAYLSQSASKIRGNKGRKATGNSDFVKIAELELLN